MCTSSIPTVSRVIAILFVLVPAKSFSGLTSGQGTATMHFDPGVGPAGVVDLVAPLFRYPNFTYQTRVHPINCLDLSACTFSTIAAAFDWTFAGKAAMYPAFNGTFLAERLGNDGELRNTYQASFDVGPGGLTARTWTTGPWTFFGTVNAAGGYADVDHTATISSALQGPIGLVAVTFHTDTPGTVIETHSDTVMTPPLVAGDKLTLSGVITFTAKNALVGVAFYGTKDKEFKEKCVGSKFKCVAKLWSDLLKCHAKAEAAGIELDIACEAKAQNKFSFAGTGCMEKAEAKGNCDVVGDGPALGQVIVPQIVTNTVTLIDPMFPAAVQSACSSAQKLCAAKLGAAKLDCRRKAVGGGKPLDLACDTKAEDVFSKPNIGCMEVAQGLGGCVNQALTPADLKTNVGDMLKTMMGQLKPACGDGVRAPAADEDCDDGNQNDSDDCTNACRDPACGDGITWNQGAGTEQCDHGLLNGFDGQCDINCQLVL
jgi:cysteine-rich repeat protein